MSLRPVAVGTRTQSLVDDFLVAQSGGISERLHPMTRLPTPVLQAEAPWERPEVGGLWGSLNAVYDPDEGLFRLWYRSLGAYPALAPADPGYQCYATSRDGLNWERPNLGIFSYEGSTANNIIGASSRGYGPAHGMLDCAAMADVEPPEVRFKSVGSESRDDKGRGTHGVSFSSDGVRWRPYEHNPILRGYQRGDAASAAMLQFGPTPEGPTHFPTARYALFPKVHIEIGQQSHDVPWRRRCFTVCTSVDDAEGLPFTNWTEPMLVLAPDQLDDDMAEERLAAAKPLLLRDHPDDHRCEFYGLVAWRSGDIFLGMIWVYDAAFELSRIGGGSEYAIVEAQLVASRNLIHWHRAGSRQPVIARGEPGTFDSHMIFYHSRPLTVGDEWWVYYVGFNEGHAAKALYDEALREQYWADIRVGRRHFPAVGLAKVRRDGFVSRDAGAEGGTLTTRLLQPGGSGLELNASVAEGGAIAVEVQDEYGAALPGFDLADCTPVTGDSLRHTVHWGDRRGDDAWLERPVRLRFQLRDASLYTFRMTDAV
ncbi:MAG: hypothetical protein CL878_11830 [Dehalococcoidia bacterium]|nr:hypothetical protein [Dehalococcoidia bacterium]